MSFRHVSNEPHDSFDIEQGKCCESQAWSNSPKKMMKWTLSDELVNFKLAQTPDVDVEYELFVSRI